MPLRPNVAPVGATLKPALDPATPPASVGYRDLAALRAQLSGNGQVNPPEAAEALKEEMFQPQTRETEEGGAEPIAAASPAETDSAPPAKRKRRTKAEMEADRTASAVVSESASAPAVTTPTAAAPAGGTTELILELRRIADAMEKIACRGN